MALTRLQMANEVLDNMSRAGAGTTRSGTTLSARAVTWLNRAQTAIARKYDLLHKISTAATVTSQKDYSFPSNLRALFSIRLESGLNSRKLECVMPGVFDQAYPKPNELATSKPTIYIPYKSSNTFELFRIPDAAYTMRMRHSVWPSDMSTDGANSGFQDFNIDLDDALVAYATAYGYEYLQELVDAQVWRTKALTYAKDVWLAEKESFPDWISMARGFSAEREVPVSEYYNDPFIYVDP